MAILSKSNVEALIPVENQKEIIKSAVQASKVLSLSTRLANMSRGQRRVPVMSVLPHAYFVDGVPGDTPTANTAGFKQTTSAAWENVYINAEEVACIAPIPISVLEDADYDIFGEIQPYIAQAFGTVIDKAILYGTNKPTSWPDGVVTQAKAAGYEKAIGTTGPDLWDAFLGDGGIVSIVEESGAFPTGILAKTSMRGKIRGAKDSTGQPLFRNSAQETQTYTIDGIPIEFDMTDVLSDFAVTGDWSKLVYSVRTDMTYKVLSEAVIQDPETKAIIYNLAQQDMVALRCYMRLGWALPKPVNPFGRRLPFAVMVANP